MIVHAHLEPDHLAVHHYNSLKAARKRMQDASDRHLKIKELQLEPLKAQEQAAQLLAGCKIHNKIVAFKDKEKLAPAWSSRLQIIKIVRDVAQKHGVSVEDIKSSSRFQLHAAARREAIAKVVEATGMSSVRVGHMFNRDHSTVLSAIRKWNKENGTDIKCVATHMTSFVKVKL